MFEIPEEYKTVAQNSLAGATSVLPPPYPAPEMYWRNGDSSLASLDEIKTAMRFGGWGIDYDAVSKIDNLPTELPNTWHLHENLVSQSNGKQYNAYMTRHAHVAPIVRRYRWNSFTNRSEVQYLCYLAEKGINPWGYVVISAKSLDTKVLDGIFDEFKKKSEGAREGTPINYFFVAIGTFGDKPKFETRGKGNKTSQVTPPQLFVPESGFNSENLKQVFVGKEIAADIYIALNDPAVKEWVDAWKSNDKQQTYTPQVLEDETPMPNEEDFPF